MGPSGEKSNAKRRNAEGCASCQADSEWSWCESPLCAAEESQAEEARREGKARWCRSRDVVATEADPERDGCREPNEKRDRDRARPGIETSAGTH